MLSLVEKRKENYKKTEDNGDNSDTTCCVTFLKFLFSTAGVWLLLSIYSVLGTMMFIALEQKPREARLRIMQEEALELQTKLVDLISLRCLHIDCTTNRTGYSSEISPLVLLLQKGSYKKTVNGWDGTFPGQATKNKWDFINALLYAVTIITTIGYGHVVPKTSFGQGATIVYAMFGIPLVLLYFATTGSFMANLFRVVYHRLCCNACCATSCRKCENSGSTSDLSAEKRTSGTTTYNPSSTRRTTSSRRATAAPSAATSKRSRLQSNKSVRALRQKSKISTGESKLTRHLSKKSHKNSSNRHKSRSRIKKKLPTSRQKRSSSNRQAGKNRNNSAVTKVSPTSTASEKGIANLQGQDSRSLLLNLAGLGVGQNETDNNRMSLVELRNEYVTWKNKFRYMSVPISLTVLVMLTYILLGAMIFTLWENWSFVESFYFTFVTLTTIGLGDLVPGFNKDNDVISAVCAAYVFLGIALIAMCMDLMQAEVKACISALAEKLGIMKGKRKKRQTDTEAIFAAIHS